MYSSISISDPGKKSGIYCVVGQVSSESKIKLVSCELSTKSLLGLSTLEDIRAIDAYIICGSLLSILFPDVLSIFFNIYARVLGFSVFQLDLLSKVYGLDNLQ